MVSIAEIEIDLFAPKLPGLDELKQLTCLVNSSEANKLAFTEQIAAHPRKNLSAGIGLVMLGRNEEAIVKLEKCDDCREKLLYSAYAYRGLGEYDKAISKFKKAKKMRAYYDRIYSGGHN